MPERTIYHGEDERRSRHKEPLSRAGSCYQAGRNLCKPPARRHGPVDTQEVRSWPRTDVKPKVTWRQHERTIRHLLSMSHHARRQQRASRAIVSRGGHGRMTLPRAGHRGICARRAPVFECVEGEAEAQACECRGLKRQQRENVRVAMPGGARQAAAEGGAARYAGSGWNLPGRNNLTGAGSEPLKIVSDVTLAPRAVGVVSGTRLLPTSIDRDMIVRPSPPKGRPRIRTDLRPGHDPCSPDNTNLPAVGHQYRIEPESPGRRQNAGQLHQSPQVGSSVSDRQVVACVTLNFLVNYYSSTVS